MYNLRILGSYQLVVRVLWLMKYISPSAVVACSQFSGRGPRLRRDVAGLVLGLEQVIPDELERDPALSFLRGSSQVVVCVK